MKHLVRFLILLVLTSPAAAATFEVSPDGSGAYPTIMAAISVSTDGDTVLLADGIYTGDGNRDLANASRWIVIRSESGDPEQCIIDCQANPADQHYGIWLDITGSEAPNAIVSLALEGVTITNAYGHSGAAVRISDGAGPTFRNCRFIDNVAVHKGGVVDSDESGGVFENCLFAGNRAESGGAMHLGSYFFLDAIDCTFVGNSADLGGAITLRMSSYHVNLINCTFVDNSAAIGANFYLHDASAAIMENCILAFGGAGEAVSCESGSSAALNCCDVFGNEGGDWTGCIAGQLGVVGNIAEDPLFCAPNMMDYHISEDSPCAAFSPPNPECDLIGAWPIGCGPTAVQPSSWGAIKAIYGR